ncbi:hypothetical protein BD769DRAFT_1388879 [Suillus cothurnatus]|nr:hypothetical protein BD769DRAFT_1388879 [Suillus cothurnatus]
MALFNDVHYVLASSTQAGRHKKLSALLDLHGATSAPPHTHIIALAGSHIQREYEGSLHVVSDMWVQRSVVLGKLQPTKALTVNVSVVACATDLSQWDLEVLSAGITSLGGQWRTALTRDVTHLFALHKQSDKQFRITQNMNVLDTATPPAPGKLSPSALIPPKNPASVLNKLKTSPGGFYAGTPRLAYRAEYFTGGRDGNILITKGLDHDEEFIIRGVFEISRKNFFFTPDGDFNPANVFHGRLADLKLSCRLTAGRSKAFKFSSRDFPTVVNNLSAFENLVPKERYYETISVIQDAIGHGRSIKLTHNLFEANDEAQGGTSDEDGNGSTAITHPDSLGSEFDIVTWPVADRCKGHLQDVASKHNICPLPAYDQNHVLIPPLQYEAKLKGALVEVHMAFYHHRVKKSRRDIFEAVLRELIVLSPPAPMPSSRFKRRRLDDGPCTERRNK